LKKKKSCFAAETGLEGEDGTSLGDAKKEGFQQTSDHEGSGGKT